MGQLSPKGRRIAQYVDDVNYSRDGLREAALSGSSVVTAEPDLEHGLFDFGGEDHNEARARQVDELSTLINTHLQNGDTPPEHIQQLSDELAGAMDSWEDEMDEHAGRLSLSSVMAAMNPKRKTGSGLPDEDIKIVEEVTLDAEVVSGGIIIPSADMGTELAKKLSQNIRVSDKSKEEQEAEEREAFLAGVKERLELTAVIPDALSDYAAGLLHDFAKEKGVDVEALGVSADDIAALTSMHMRAISPDEEDTPQKQFNVSVGSSFDYSKEEIGLFDVEFVESSAGGAESLSARVELSVKRMLEQSEEGRAKLATMDEFDLKQCKKFSSSVYVRDLEDREEARRIITEEFSPRAELMVKALDIDVSPNELAKQFSRVLTTANDLYSWSDLDDDKSIAASGLAKGLVQHMAELLQLPFMFIDQKDIDTGELIYNVVFDNDAGEIGLRYDPDADQVEMAYWTYSKDTVSSEKTHVFGPFDMDEFHEKVVCRLADVSHERSGINSELRDTLQSDLFAATIAAAKNGLMLSTEDEHEGAAVTLPRTTPAVDFRPPRP
jgi:hypothetical protein